MKTKILIVEDDPHILLGLEEVLKSEGYETASCNRGDEAAAAFTKFQPALLVLDVMLPGLSGYDICKQLRAKKVVTPILMLTAKGQEIDKVIGLDLGADDYVTKPFGVRELLARIQALLRRSGSGGAAPEADESPFQIGTATIDPKTFQLKRGRVAEDLTAKEVKLLQGASSVWRGNRRRTVPSAVFITRPSLPTAQPCVRSASTSTASRRPLHTPRSSWVLQVEPPSLVANTNPLPLSPPTAQRWASLEAARARYWAS